MIDSLCIKGGLIYALEDHIERYYGIFVRIERNNKLLDDLVDIIKGELDERIDRRDNGQRNCQGNINGDKW